MNVFLLCLASLEHAPHPKDRYEIFRIPPTEQFKGVSYHPVRIAFTQARRFRNELLREQNSYRWYAREAMFAEALAEADYIVKAWDKLDDLCNCCTSSEENADRFCRELHQILGPFCYYAGDMPMLIDFTGSYEP